MLELIRVLIFSSWVLFVCVSGLTCVGGVLVCSRCRMMVDYKVEMSAPCSCFFALQDDYKVETVSIGMQEFFVELKVSIVRTDSLSQIAFTCS
jgi:hypothetical protein